MRAPVFNLIPQALQCKWCFVVWDGKEEMEQEIVNVKKRAEKKKEKEWGVEWSQFRTTDAKGGLLVNMHYNNPNLLKLINC